MLPRTAASELSRVAVRASVRVAGRVVASTHDGFTLQDDTGCVTVQTTEVPATGALVQATGRYHEHRLCELTELVAFSAGNSDFTRAESDWTFLVGARLTNLRGRAVINKRYLCGVIAFNLCVLMRKLTGWGTPKQTAAASRRLSAARERLWRALCRRVVMFLTFWCKRDAENRNFSFLRRCSDFPCAQSGSSTGS